jgi:hypothetical protein
MDTATADREAPSLFRREAGAEDSAPDTDVSPEREGRDGDDQLTADELAALAVDDRPRTDPFFFDRLAAGQVPPKGATAQATLISNGHEVLTVPETEMRKAEGLAGCEHCGGDFPARKHTGGKPRRFCSDKCRSAHHAGCSPPSNSTVKPTSNAPTFLRSAPTVDGLRNEAAAIIAELSRADIPQELVARVVKAITPPEAPDTDTDDEGSHEFRWDTPEDQESVVLAEQRAVAIYLNKRNDLVIRQERAWNEDEDAFVVIEKQNARQFAFKLCEFLEIDVRKA